MSVSSPHVHDPGAMNFKVCWNVDMYRISLCKRSWYPLTQWLSYISRLLLYNITYLLPLTHSWCLPSCVYSTTTQRRLTCAIVQHHLLHSKSLRATSYVYYCTTLFISAYLFMLSYDLHNAACLYSLGFVSLCLLCCEYYPCLWWLGLAISRSVILPTKPNSVCIFATCTGSSSHEFQRLLGCEYVSHFFV